ncbi:RluA family pseudouridine synthase [Altericroceibacterium endophyticum]|uniref:Ribosomal large subunit pseudouridine synthase D n=1 Tax=Altericroceibacterium endophyticum TaxID=1808508 RepID=A0A6I4T6I3_9SPHN|nr:RluA family pseudouridine synthase [Altericroceibacterium endophyticum]MXO66526.1 RluA family pseudouridine synthase [Altericroceibacterium endophyticum]
MSNNGPSDNVRQFTVQHDDDGIRVDRWFKRHLPQIGFGTVSKWARTGQIRVDGKRVKPEDRLASGQTLRVPPGGEPAQRKTSQRRELTEEQILKAEAMVITQDRSAIVLNKPPGLATQGGTGTTQHVDGLLDAFAGEDDPRPRLVHRLDKDTSGVLLVARTPGSAAFFSKRFSGRSARKVYWALVVGVPDIAEGMIDAPLSKQPGSGGEKMQVDEEHGQLARTRYRMVERAGNSAAWIELEPLTGRTHQLRVHMAAIGHPIVGDGKYGGQDAFLTGTISRKMHLHARRLIIDHPVGEKLDVMAELPEHFAASMEQLGFDLTLSDAEPEQGPPPPGKEERKQAARQHAKQYRKERRGERRKRADGPAAERTSGRPADRPVKKSGPKKGKGSPVPKSQLNKKAGGKPAPRPSRSSTGRPSSKRPSGRPSSRPSSGPRKGGK